MLTYDFTELLGLVITAICFLSCLSWSFFFFFALAVCFLKSLFCLSVLLSYICSRSQCIINLRCTANELSRGDGVHANDAVLTIIDLTGAEREKRTGNQVMHLCLFLLHQYWLVMLLILTSGSIALQGARLLESNFINNTSMVFGLCLRVCKFIMDLPGILAVLFMMIMFSLKICLFLIIF